MAFAGERRLIRTMCKLLLSGVRFQYGSTKEPLSLVQKRVSFVAATLVRGYLLENDTLVRPPSDACSIIRCI